MKPIYSKFRNLTLPVFIILPAMVAHTHAAIISPDAAGNVTVFAGTNAASTVGATGGTSPAPVVTIEAGATLTGDPVPQSGIDVLVPGYTILNSGTINVAREGIFVDAASSADTTIFNESGGIIQGGSDAIFFNGNGGEVANAGTIKGFGSRGINALDDALIFNSGVIEGDTDAVFAGNNLELVNEGVGVIDGLGSIGVNAGDNAEIFNEINAEISGDLGGIILDASGFVENDGLIDGFAGDGIAFGINGEVFNTGLIQGTTGISTLGTSTITNSGTILSNVVNGDAFLGGIGNDSLFLNEGSFISGNVVGGGGIDTIIFTGGLTSPTSPENTIRGSVIDFSTITKNGGGVALIGDVGDVNTGLIVTADTINITGGGLYINADVSGTTVLQTTINSGGTALGGTGIWDANINLLAGGISAGAIPINLDSNPENAVGALTITGDVTHSPGSFIRVDIVPDAPIVDGFNSDVIDQTGLGNIYNLNGGNLRISSTDPNRVLTAGTYTIIDSDEPIVGASFGTIGVQFNNNTPNTGNFEPTGSGVNYLDSVLTNFFLTPGLADGGTNLVLGINYSFASLPGLDANQAAIGGVLDRLALTAGSGTLGLQEQDLIAALTLSDLQAVQNSLSALVPGAHLEIAAGIVNSNYRLHRMAQNHLATSRSSSGMTTVETAPATYDAKGGMIPAQTAGYSNASRGSFWGSLSYDWQDYEGTTTARDFDGETGAITAGFDYRISPRFLLGGMIDGSKSDFDGSGGNTDVDSLRFALYGTYGESLGFYSDMLVGYGKHDIEQSRTVGGILGLAGNREFETDADSLQALLTLGFAMGNEQFKHGPFAGVEYQNLELDGFADNGGLINVSVDGHEVDSLRGLIGYRMDATVGNFRPYASVAYAHEFEDGSSNSTASIGGVQFQVGGSELESAILLSAGTGIAFSPSLVMDIGYRGELSMESNGLDSHGGSLGLTYSF